MLSQKNLKELASVSPVHDQLYHVDRILLRCCQKQPSTPIDFYIDSITPDFVLMFDEERPEFGECPRSMADLILHLLVHFGVG
jgi:hypothetical protein